MKTFQRTCASADREADADSARLVAEFAERMAADPAPHLPWRQNLALYLDRLSAYNSAFNLVGKRTPEDILAVLAADSFHLAALLEGVAVPDCPLVLDCGAGAGLPGIPLRMLWQKGEYILAETRTRRALFMENILAELKLPGTRVYCGDAAKFPSKPDIIISRAWLSPQPLLNFAAQRLGENGMVIIFARDLPSLRHEAFRRVTTLEYASPTGKRSLLAFRHVCVI